MPSRPLIAVSCGPMWRTPLEDAFGAIKAAGGEGVEIMVTQNLETQTPRVLERLAERNDLPIVAVHAPLLLLTRTVYTTDPLEKIRRTMELSRALGVQTIVLHPPYVWQVRYSLWLVHELQEAAAGTGVDLTMENMYPIHVGSRRLGFHRFQTPESLGRFEHVTLDTSHLGVAGEDPVEAYQALADRVTHVHLSDNRGRGRDSHAPIGEGVLDIPAFLEALDPTRLRSVALEMNVGAIADDRADLETLLGSQLEIVRKHLRTTAE